MHVGVEVKLHMFLITVLCVEESLELHIPISFAFGIRAVRKKAVRQKWPASF
jgi:hypothetical protein